jgi:hypothetical protein
MLYDMPSERHDKRQRALEPALSWFHRRTAAPTKKPKKPGQKSQKQTPRGVYRSVSLSARLAWIGGITRYFHISNNHYICTMTILLVPTFGLAVGLEYFPGDDEWPTDELVLNIVIFKIVIQWQ